MRAFARVAKEVKYLRQPAPREQKLLNNLEIRSYFRCFFFCVFHRMQNKRLKYKQTQIREKQKNEQTKEKKLTPRGFVWSYRNTPISFHSLKFKLMGPWDVKLISWSWSCSRDAVFPHLFRALNKRTFGRRRWINWSTKKTLMETCYKRVSVEPL